MYLDEKLTAKDVKLLRKEINEAFAVSCYVEIQEDSIEIITGYSASLKDIEWLKKRFEPEDIRFNGVEFSGIIDALEIRIIKPKVYD